MYKSAIILAGGSSTRFTQDKGLTNLANKPLVKHVINAVDKIVDEKIIVASSSAQAENYAKILDSDIKFIADQNKKAQTPLIGALTGFGKAAGEYSLLLPCDTPFISKEIISLLFELCVGKNAAIPRWPNGNIEPLQAVYATKHAFKAAEEALAEEKLNLQAMIDKLRNIRYVSTLVLQQLDPELKTFFNVNTPLDLRKAEYLISKQRV